MQRARAGSVQYDAELIANFRRQLNRTSFFFVIVVPAVAPFFAVVVMFAMRLVAFAMGFLLSVIVTCLVPVPVVFVGVVIVAFVFIVRFAMLSLFGMVVPCMVVMFDGVLFRRVRVPRVIALARLFPSRGR